MRTLVIALGLAAGSAPLFGQQDTSARRDTALLAPTIVTVTRTPAELGRAAMAVGVSTKGDIQRGKPGLALDEALAGIAGVQVDNRYNYALGERISVRGMGARAQFGVRGVRVILDGIPMTLADGQTTLNNVDVGALARAEVIRGPASALHGNAAGGVIQLESDFDDVGGALGGEVRLAAGAHGLMRSQASWAGRGAATGAFASLSRLRFDGYRQWSAARNDHGTLRFARGQGDRLLSVVINAVDYDGRNPGGLSRALLAVSRDTAFATNLRDRTGERGRQIQGGLTWRRPVRGARLDMSAHVLTREIENPIPQRIVAIERAAAGYRVAASGAPRVAGRRLELAAGTELQVQGDDRRNFVSDSGRRAADTLSQFESILNGALFAQAALEVTSRVRASAGIREDRVSFTADDRLIGPGNPDDSGERLMRALSPSFGLSIALTPRIDLYATAATSFETPTTSELANQESGAGGFNPLLEPQRARSVEAGVNGRLRAGGVLGTWQLAAYRMRVTDALVPFEIPSVPGRQYFRNAGSTRHEGIEAATSLLLHATASARIAFTHTDARFEDYAVTTGSTTRVYDGNRVPGVAANRLDGTLTLAPGPLTLDLDARSSSSIAVDDANSDRSAAFTVWGLRATAAPARLGGVTVTPHVGVTNIFAASYNTSVVVNAFGGRYFEPAPGRFLGAGLRAAF
jgi:iron complex outermembrane receptor protein